MSAYFNENDPFAAQWLRNLIEAGHIAAGDVDERSIVDVRPDDLRGYTQCHFFAGIGGWSYALWLAGWDDDRPVWTGSCPCQPFSAAGQQKGEADERHLWPEFRRLIAECRPATVFGEQVASKLGREWLSGVRTDLEALGFAVGAADLGAASVGAPHIRQRLWWVAHTDQGERGRITACEGRESNGETTGRQQGDCVAQPSGAACRMGDASGEGSGRNTGTVSSAQREGARQWGAAWGLSDQLELTGATLIPCADGKARRVGPGVQPMVDGIPASLGYVGPEAAARLEKEMIDVAASEGHPGEALHDLRQALVAETVRRPAGRFDSVHEAPVLLAFMRQLAHEGRAFAEGFSRAGEETQESSLRVLRGEKAASCPSRQRGLEEQRADQSPNLVRVLSSILALHAQAAWGDAFAAHAGAGYPLAVGVSARVGRLRGYGNAIVAQVAAEFIRAARETGIG